MGKLTIDTHNSYALIIIIIIISWEGEHPNTITPGQLTQC